MPGNPAGSGARFDRWASTYEASPLQPALFAPVHQTTLQLAQQLLPDARRILDVGCGTGRLLRQPRQRYWRAELVGVDLARGMVAAAIAATPHRTRSPLHPRRCRTLALHRGGLRPGGRHHVDAPLDRSGGRDRRDRPGPHPRWRVRPCRRLPQQPTPNPHGVHALTPPSTQSPYSFERRWTVVMLADLLLGHSQSLRIEVPGKQGEGAEFRLLAHGVPEWHQAKRQRGGGPWTIANMATEGILGPWWPKIQAGGRCVFVSGRRKAKTRGSIRLGGPPSQRGPRRRPRRSLGPRPARPG
jgi:SAM-dependent methyltransferase